jgi:hypothetical protein
LECIGCVDGKNSLRDSRGELLSINADIATRGKDVILEWIGCALGKNSLHDSRCELLSINAVIATRGCDVIFRNQKVQKAPKHYFWTYWS